MRVLLVRFCGLFPALQMIPKPWLCPGLICHFGKEAFVDVKQNRSWAPKDGRKSRCLRASLSIPGAVRKCNSTACKSVGACTDIMQPYFCIWPFLRTPPQGCADARGGLGGFRD